jgi:hypothetical protein
VKNERVIQKRQEFMEIVKEFPQYESQKRILFKREHP